MKGNVQGSVIDSMIRINKFELENYVKEIFCKAGLSEEDGQIVSRHLVLANLRGVDSHGVTRVSNYIKRLESGVVSLNNSLKIIRESTNSVLIDGANRLGIITATEGIKIAVDKAKSNGIAIVGIKNSNHCGMLADYTSCAAENDCIALATTNAPPNMAPWGGRERYFGTNPLSYSIPCGEEKNIIFDMATSVVARGKIKLALKNNENIPVGWAITKEGEPTTDAKEAMDGLVLPVGGPKGYGLALLVDVLSGLLTGAAFGPYIGRPENYREMQKLGQFFFVMRSDIFEDLETFKKRMDQMCKEIKNVPLAKGFDRIFLPGEIEYETAEERTRLGIPLSYEVVAELTEIGKRYGIASIFS